MAQNQNNDEVHFRELRRRILTWAGLFIIVFLVALYYSKNILNLLLSYAERQNLNMKFAYIYPQEVFMQYFSISLTVAILTTLPVLIFQAALFLMPAIDDKDKPSAILWFIVSVILFYMGMAFAVFIMIPFVLEYFDGLNSDTVIQGMISIEKYISLIKMLVYSFGLSFEIPTITAIFTKLRILTPEIMKRIRPVMIVVIFTIAAFITPPDVLSQFMIAVPMCILYQISIGICNRIIKKREKDKENG